MNIFGIPFSFLPQEGDGENGTPKPPKPKTQIEALKERAAYEIRWPNIVRMDRVWKPRLTLNAKGVPPLVLDAEDTRLRADLAPVIDGKSDLTQCAEIDLEKLERELRMQQIVFKAASEVYDMMKTAWQGKGTKLALFGQVVHLTEAYLSEGEIIIEPRLFETSPLRRRILYMLQMNRIVQHLWDYIKLEQAEELVPVYDSAKRVRSTADMLTWYTTKPCEVTRHSQISHIVCDSGWEATEAYLLEKNPHVAAWAKNDHLGFSVIYTFEGVVRRYFPDFLIRLDNGTILVLETKGQETDKDKAKRRALAEWVKAVNSAGEFGRWVNDVSYSVKDVDGIIGKYI